ncbi:hypothetical protein [Legionella maioricensis]|uniref:Uncharacterized protein n=1 Tax=Legionella maioricensis TaxID=2896528 RepID=A0A9X2IBF6_9GAMM|nr:hypothetical protein [Legionella maioricensis]MCL9682733.1 hypothetical protein [Legionella maioricensis]MCL9687219.1 hypothetical protein [Legionella maioricensis]
MPSSFYINETNRVLHYIPSGKYSLNTKKAAGLPNSLAITYIDNGQIFKLTDSQTPQIQYGNKGGLCWYYAAKHTHYGRFFMGKSANSDEAKKRKEEIIISTFRKQCTALSLIKEIEDDFVDHFNDNLQRQAIKANETQSADQVYSQSILNRLACIPSPSEPLKIQMRLLKDFLDSGQPDLTYFLLDRHAQFLINAINEVSANLGFPIKEAVDAYLKKLNLLPENLSLDQLSTHYDHIIITHIWKSLGYAQSSWRPEKKLTGLIQELRQGTCLAEIDLALVTLSSNLRHTFGEHGLGYFVSDVSESDAEKGEDTHIINIIGAEIDSDENGYVYFIDPNDASIPGSPRIVHKISYALFCEILVLPADLDLDPESSVLHRQTQ